MEKKEDAGPKVIALNDKRPGCFPEADDELEASIDEMKFNSTLFALHNFVGVGDHLLNELEEQARQLYSKKGSESLQQVLEAFIAFCESFNTYFTCD